MTVVLGFLVGGFTQHNILPKVKIKPSNQSLTFLFTGREVSDLVGAWGDDLVPGGGGVVTWSPTSPPSRVGQTYACENIKRSNRYADGKNGPSANVMFSLLTERFLDLFLQPVLYYVLSYTCTGLRNKDVNMLFRQSVQVGYLDIDLAYYCSFDVLC